jgi:NAD(P)-dependent dehydrogenase (short-subunit alcohol dehydrogenase family)
MQSPEHRIVGIDDLRGRVAVVTGAASGIGAALASQLAAAGMAVAVADVDVDGAERVAAQLVAGGHRAIAVPTDVTDLDAVRRLAARSADEFGAVSLLCSNAGALAFGSLAALNTGDWQWMSSINVGGFLNCIEAFIPAMVAADDWRHVLVTASSHGFIDGGGKTAIYSATKHAVVCLAESLRVEVEPHDVGVTMLCPGPTASRILDSQRNRSAAFGPAAAEPFGTGQIPGGASPDEVAASGIDAVLANAPYAFPHGSDRSGFRGQIESRWRRIDASLASDVAVR